MVLVLHCSGLRIHQIFLDVTGKIRLHVFLRRGKLQDKHMGFLNLYLDVATLQVEQVSPFFALLVDEMEMKPRYVHSREERWRVEAHQRSFDVLELKDSLPLSSIKQLLVIFGLGHGPAFDVLELPSDPQSIDHVGRLEEGFDCCFEHRPPDEAFFEVGFLHHGRIEVREADERRFGEWIDLLGGAIFAELVDFSVQDDGLAVQLVEGSESEVPVSQEICKGGDVRDDSFYECVDGCTDVQRSASSLLPDLPGHVSFLSPSLKGRTDGIARVDGSFDAFSSAGCGSRPRGGPGSRSFAFVGQQSFGVSYPTFSRLVRRLLSPGLLHVPRSYRTCRSSHSQCAPPPHFGGRGRAAFRHCRSTSCGLVVCDDVSFLFVMVVPSHRPSPKPRVSESTSSHPLRTTRRVRGNRASESSVAWEGGKI